MTTHSENCLSSAVDSKHAGLELLRAPFPPHQISKLPKGTKAQNECPSSDKRNCHVCGGWHHPQIKHLDYVGHAALTDRLLDADPTWSWEPLAIGPDGLPVLDRYGGMWIKLTICGVTRIGYGSADGKEGGNAVKEIIGDGLRNTAMRFGAALELWHKGDLHLPSPSDEEHAKSPPAEKPEEAEPMSESRIVDWITVMGDQPTAVSLKAKLADAKQACMNMQSPRAYSRIVDAAKARAQQLEAAE